jgi:hypothetical protein
MLATKRTRQIEDVTAARPGITSCHTRAPKAPSVGGSGGPARANRTMTLRQPAGRVRGLAEHHRPNIGFIAEIGGQ